MKTSCTLKQFLTGLIVSLSFTFTAQAGLINVKSIEISNALGDWLQVAEVVALDMLGNDVALSSAGAVASSPDTWDSKTSAINAIDGNTLGNYSLSQIFHEGQDGSNDTLTITFASLVELMSIQIFGRTDCCTQRDFYKVTFLDASAKSLFTIQADSRNGAHPVIELPNTVQQSVVNEVSAPGTIALFGLALVVLGLSRRFIK